ncbi:MAG: hypothetical protein IJ112_05560 [Oscillospiraceae bacterium]|nr:hypothetical protein [Oscillospiraceae bacterium]
MKKRVWSILLVLCMVLTLLPAAALAAGAPNVSYAQKTANERTVTVTIADLNAAKALSDTVKITATMSNGGKVTETATFEKTLSETGASFDIELPYFGKWDMTAAFGDAAATGTAALTASEYNIILGGATTDVLVESLHFFIGNPMNNSVPTIVSLARFKQYNWDQLPENMYRDPLLTAEENNSEASWAGVKVPAMAAYVKQLHELNSASKFNFYISDFQLNDLPKVIYNNKLPAENYTLTLVTDGSATYSCFKHTYDNVDDAQAVHDQRVAEFQAYKNGTGSLSESIN